MITFAAHGIGATTLKMVVGAAGFSVGLVQHYFKSKANLITAVDDCVLTFIADEMNSSRLPEPPADPLLEAGNRLTSMIAKRAEVLEYAGRCLVEGEAMGPVIFDGLLRVSIL